MSYGRGKVVIWRAERGFETTFGMFVYLAIPRLGHLALRDLLSSGWISQRLGNSRLICRPCAAVQLELVDGTRSAWAM